HSATTSTTTTRPGSNRGPSATRTWTSGKRTTPPTARTARPAPTGGSTNSSADSALHHRRETAHTNGTTPSTKSRRVSDLLKGWTTGKASTATGPSCAVRRRPVPRGDGERPTPT